MKDSAPGGSPGLARATKRVAQLKQDTKGGSAGRGGTGRSRQRAEGRGIGRPSVSRPSAGRSLSRPERLSNQLIEGPGSAEVWMRQHGEYAAEGGLAGRATTAGAQGHSCPKRRGPGHATTTCLCCAFVLLSMNAIELHCPPPAVSLLSLRLESLALPLTIVYNCLTLPHHSPFPAPTRNAPWHPNAPFTALPPSHWACHTPSHCLPAYCPLPTAVSYPLAFPIVLCPRPWTDSHVAAWLRGYVHHHSTGGDWHATTTPPCSRSAIDTHLQANLRCMTAMSQRPGLWRPRHGDCITHTHCESPPLGRAMA